MGIGLTPLALINTLVDQKLFQNEIMAEKTLVVEVAQLF